MPDPRLTDGAVAVASWFGEPVAAAGFAEWCAGLAHADGEGPKRIVFGHPGVALDGPATVERDACLAGAGLKLSGPEVRLGTFTRLVTVDPKMFRDPGDLLPATGIYPALAAAEGAESHLGFTPTENAATRVDFVVTSPSSGYAGDAAAVISDPRLAEPIWQLDTFAFLQAVLAAPLRPVPDVTTALGRRLMFATVGPDGWLSRLPALKYGEAPILASEMLVPLLRDEFADIPVSVAVVADDLSPAIAGRAADAGRAAAAALFASAQVEIASAGTSGVQNWAFFDQFDPVREAAAVSAARQARLQDNKALLSSAIQTLGTALLTDRAKMASDVAALPRRYMVEPFSVEGEIEGGLAAVATIAPEGRRPGLFVWGDGAMPFAAAMSAPAVPSLGGGGGIATDAAAYSAGLWPFSAPVGNLRQVYDAVSSLAAYRAAGNETRSMFHAYIRTLDATESPRRLKPFQIAFSAGDMVRFGAREAIRNLFRQARSDELLPMEASRYVRIVEGFETAEIVPSGQLRWRIEKRGALATVRFDGAAELAVDLDESAGVLGARRKGAALYVALDPAAETPLVALLRSDAESGMVSTSGRPGIESSRWWIWGVVDEACGLRFTAEGFGPGEIGMVTTPGRAMAIEMTDAAAPHWSIFTGTATAAADGRIGLTLPPLPPGKRAEIALSGPCGS